MKRFPPKGSLRVTLAALLVVILTGGGCGSSDGEDDRMGAVKEAQSICAGQGGVAQLNLDYHDLDEVTCVEGPPVIEEEE